MKKYKRKAIIKEQGGTDFERFTSDIPNEERSGSNLDVKQLHRQCKELQKQLDQKIDKTVLEAELQQLKVVAEDRTTSEDGQEVPQSKEPVAAASNPVAESIEKGIFVSWCLTFPPFSDS